MGMDGKINRREKTLLKKFCRWRRIKSGRRKPESDRHPLLRRIYQSLPQMQSERASDHDTVTKRSNVADDHRCLRHESLGDTCNRETFFPEILIPKMGEHFTNLRSFKFNGSSLAADINNTEMIVAL